MASHPGKSGLHRARGKRRQGWRRGAPVFNGSRHARGDGRLASRPVLRSPLEMGDGDNLDLIWRDLAVDERVGEASNQNPACTVERTPTLRVVQDVGDLLSDGCKKVQPETLATVFVPVGRLFEFGLCSRMKPVSASGHADVVRVGRRLPHREPVGRDPSQCRRRGVGSLLPTLDRDRSRPD